MFGTLVALFAMLVLFRFQAVAAWPLAVLILLVIPHTAYVFYRVHVIFFRRKVEDRWRQIALMFLTPPACIRASDFIAHELFAGFHSLAVSRVLLNDVESRDFAARTLREMMYPLDIDDRNNSSVAAEWAKAKWMTVVWEWMENEFGDPRQLIDAPQKAKAKSRSKAAGGGARYTHSHSYSQSHFDDSHIASEKVRVSAEVAALSEGRSGDVCYVLLRVS